MLYDDIHYTDSRYAYIIHKCHTVKDSSIGYARIYNIVGSNAALGNTAQNGYLIRDFNKDLSPLR